MKKFNHLFIASIGMLSMTSPLYTISLTAIAGAVTLSFSGGVIHGALTYKKNQKTRLQMMAVTGVATATVLAVNDYLNLRTSRKTWASEIDFCKNLASSVINFSHEWSNSDGTKIIIKNESDKSPTTTTIIFSPPEAAKNFLKFNKQDVALVFLIRSGAYAVGDYIGRKLAHIINEP